MRFLVCILLVLGTARVDAACPAGKYYRAIPAGCTTCPAGQFQATGGDQTQCRHCSAGTITGVVGQAACTTCAVGSFSSGSGTDTYPRISCIPCLAGTFSDIAFAGYDVCYRCEMGQYSGSGATSCTNCDVGKYSGAYGVSECGACPGDSSSPAGSTVVSACTCNAGTSGPDGGPCTLCAAGKYKTSTGNAVCSDCAAGTYYAAQGASQASTCTPCPGDSSSPLGSPVVSSCTCNAGTSGPDGGPCTQCATGKYKTSTGSGFCSNCLEGTYTATQGSSAISPCTTCPTHSSSPQDSSSMSDCTCDRGYTGGADPRPRATVTCSGCGCQPSTGTFSGTISDGPSNYADDVDCWWLFVSSGLISLKLSSFATEKNYDYLDVYQCTSESCGSRFAHLSGEVNLDTLYESSAGSRLWVKFYSDYSNTDSGFVASWSSGSSTYQYSDIFVACTQCAAGKYKTSTGSAQCAPCASGTYSTAAGATTDATCGTGCAVGKYSLSAATTCTNCNAGYYQGSTTQDNCNTACAVGKYSLAAASACTDCTPGYYQTATASTTCTACEPNKYQTALGQTVCTTCASGLYSTTTAASTASVCLACGAGNYTNPPQTICSMCPKGTYTNVSGASTCTLCVGEQAYAPYTGMTTCFQCIEKRQISDIQKTYCFVCKDGEEEDRPNSVCVKCAIGQYSDGTTNRKCVPCREGTYAVSIGTDVCTKCRACPDSFYRVGCTITGGGGSCVQCEQCADPKTEVRIDCMNRAGHNNVSGICRKRKFTVRNPYCDTQGTGYFLGGYTFNEIFGTSQDSADFQCRGICDGFTNRLTDEMKTENNLVQYKNESFDSGYCKGPYACDVPTCVIYGVSDDSQPAYRQPAACPVVIDDALTEQLWAVTRQADYEQDPLTVAVQNMRYNVECQSCSTCGEMHMDVMKVWPLMQNYTDWGRGCARECTELSCAYGKIFDWTVSDATMKCKQCSELEDVRLCTSKQQQAFSGADISGNLPKLTFKDCQPRRIVQDGIARASYGDCLRCPQTTDACGSGKYYQSCYENLDPRCENCDTRATASSSYFNGTSTTRLYCQKTVCPDDKTGVTVDVRPHRICHRQCSKAKCASDRVELPCLLPHDKRCKASITYTDFPADEMYRKQGYVPAHANVLERVSGLHLFASFENVLISVESIPLQNRRVCVWNANGITDNDMNPAGISAYFAEACRPWTRDPDTSYALLPMQNTVTDSTEFQRRILLNTSAIAMHYLSEWHNVVRIPNVFTGDVFLDLELTNARRTALAAFVSADRLLSNVTSVVRWHVSVYAQQTVGLRDDVLIGIETPDDVQHCDECFSLQLACLPPNCTAVHTTNTTPAAAPSSISCSTTPHTAFRTSQAAAAWKDFCGDKFHVSVPKGSVYVCGASMQRRVMPGYTPSHAALAVLAGDLDVACAQQSVFAVQLANSQVLLGGTEALTGKYCLGFVFSNTSVFCLSALGAVHAISDSTLHVDAFTIRSVVVYGDSLITTVSTNLNQMSTSHVSDISSICAALNKSGTVRVLNETTPTFNHTRHTIFMLATGNPLYFLSRTESGTETTMMLRKYSCGDILLMTSTFCESDAVPVKLFSGNLPSLQTQNTLLHARGGALLFVTSTHSQPAGTVAMAVLVSSVTATRTSVALTSEAQDIVYPNNGNANRISGAWLSDSVYLLGLQDQQQMWMLTLETSVTFTLLPPAKSIFSYSFIALGGAVLTKTLAGYSLTTCMTGCTTSTSDTTAYFAFGNETLTYTRLLPCRDSTLSHVNPLELQQAPTRTCAVAELNGSDYLMQYALSLKCKQAAGVISVSLTLEPGALVRITSTNATTVVVGDVSQALFIYAQCVNASVAYIKVFDRLACAEGCTLYQVAQIQITGMLKLNYVLHSVLRPSGSMIYTLLRSSTYELPRPQLAASFNSWTQHSAFTHTMADLQRIQVNLVRRTNELFALSEPTHVALDVLQVVPTLNLQAVLHVLPTNVRVLLTLVHIPSDDDLAQLSLLDSTVRGSEVSGWRRLHATAYVRLPGVSLVDCVFDMRLVAVDDGCAPRQESSKVGCRMRVQAEGASSVGRCHIEVPFAMANSAGVLGLLVQGTCELPPPDSVTVELNPFTSMSECPEHQYLDADTAKCASCELQEAACAPGSYAAGCEAMLWQGDLLTCLPCPVPAHALFTNKSVTCSDWLCEASFFRSDSLCLNCTDALQSVCAKTAGQMWAPCTPLLNEQCVACALSGLPRNAEWTTTSESTYSSTSTAVLTTTTTPAPTSSSTSTAVRTTTTTPAPTSSSTSTAVLTTTTTPAPANRGPANVTCATTMPTGVVGGVGCTCTPSVLTSSGVISTGSGQTHLAECVWLIASTGPVSLRFSWFSVWDSLVKLRSCTTNLCTSWTILTEMMGSTDYNQAYYDGQTPLPVSVLRATYTSNTGYMQLLFTAKDYNPNDGFTVEWSTAPTSSSTSTAVLTTTTTPAPVAPGPANVTCTTTPSGGIGCTCIPSKLTSSGVISDGSGQTPHHAECVWLIASSGPINLAFTSFVVTSSFLTLRSCTTNLCTSSTILVQMSGSDLIDAVWDSTYSFLPSTALHATYTSNTGYMQLHYYADTAWNPEDGFIAQWSSSTQTNTRRLLSMTTTSSPECAWTCKPAYFNNNGICEACLSLNILKSVLSIQGTRTPGAFYKFKPCTQTRQAEFTTCQFERQLNVTYTGDATEFLRDCPVRCAEYLHVVDTTVLDSQNATWKAAQCIQCPLDSQPAYVNGSLVPRSSYDMDASCSATCRAAAAHYAVEGAGSRCAYCPVGLCPYGQYAATADGCVSCRDCSSHLEGAFIFQREGLVNDNVSCQEVCAPGYYLADDGVLCLPHTDVRCLAGQFKLNGTARSDARCDECTDCNGYRQVRACSRTQDAKCESCGPLVWWSSFWNGTECDLACKSAYTKLYMPRARCQRCSACPNGFERTPIPANCSDCTACATPKPEHAEYISQCAWKCEKYHALRLDDDTALPLCVYSVEWSTNVPAPAARRQYNVSCSKGQTLTDELICADCAAPPGLNRSNLNVAWMWTGVGCAWQCMPALMHVINSTAQQHSCLTRAEYLALVLARRTPLTPPLRSLNYSILLMVVVPLTFAMVACGVLKRN